jgi:2-polyprenyl-3-methyl-5-hydroxy-6-metoxy-1,4-benzoquinol methylase
MAALESVHEKTRQAYNLAAEKYHQLFHNELNEKAYDRELLDSFAAKFTPSSRICDAGCGPSGHIGRYLFDKGMNVVGVDISDRCIEIATDFNPCMQFSRENIARMSFDPGAFDGVVSYYSIIHTPKKSASKIFSEFNRVLKPQGYLLVAVKAGEDERFLSELLGIKTEIYFSWFTEPEIETYLTNASFRIELLEKRNPYDFELKNERIFAVGKKNK